MNNDDSKAVMMWQGKRISAKIEEKKRYTKINIIGFLTEREGDLISFFKEIGVFDVKNVVIIDMTDVFLIDHFGIANIIILNGMLGLKNKKLGILVNGKSNILSRLNASDVSKIIPIYSDKTIVSLSE
jgi:anti-anti-sigma regulatory factor